MSENRGDRTQRHAERGGALLLWALTFSVAVLMLIQANFPFFQNTVSTGAQNFRREQALALADAGLEHALWEIRNNNGASLVAAGATGGWTAALGSTACDDEIDGNADGLLYGVAVTSCKRFPSTSQAKPVIAGDWFGGTIGTYRVWVVNFGTSSARIVAQSYAPNETNPLSTRTVAVDVEQIATARYAAMGDDFLEIHGKTTIESYNSTLGAFGVAGNRFENGHIGTNGSRNLPYDLTINSDGMADPTQLSIDGTEYLATGNQHLYTGAWTDGPNAVVTQSPQPLPTTVTVPPGMFPTYIQTAWTGGFTGNDAGDFKCTGTCVCDSAVHIKSLYVLGTVRMDAGCQMFIDKQGSMVPYTATPGGAVLDTDGTGRLLKNSTETTQIFVKDGALNLDGGGVQWNTAAIAASELKPEKLQIYNTGNNAYTAMAQKEPFYGLVFVADNDGNATEAGALELHPGNVLGVVYDAIYHGAFIAGGKLIVGDINSGTYRTTIRFDEALLDLLLDGSGAHAPGIGDRYRVVRRSWQPKDKKAATTGW